MNRSTQLIIRDYFLFLIIFTCLTLYANWVFFTGNSELAVFIPPFSAKYFRMEQTHLGGEYLNIAQAIYKGQGFSNPFGYPTGPTGWSPPMLVYALTIGLHLFDGSIEMLTKAFLGGQILILAFTATSVSHIARCLKNQWASFLAMAIVISVNFKWIFQVTHDAVYQMFWINLIVIGLSYGWKTPKSCTKIILWGVLGGLSALSSPIVGFTWIVATAIVWRFRQWRSILIAFIASIVVVAPWASYQTVRLGKFTPIKSNLAYELYQSQVLLPDGLMSENVFKLHPYEESSIESQRYLELGEAAYLEEKKIQFWQAVIKNPFAYVKKTLKRLVASTILLHDEMNIDRRKMKFIIVRCLAPLPFVGLLAFLYRQPDYKCWVSPAVICFCTFLIPYIFISYYERYGVAVTLPRILFTMFLLIAVKERYMPRKNMQ